MAFTTVFTVAFAREIGAKAAGEGSALGNNGLLQ